MWSAIQWRDIVPGAQTRRRGGAGPVGVLLRGWDPPAVSFGSETCRPRTGHQSGPGTSPPDGVIAAHQVAGFIPGDSVRTLPSTSPVTIPPGWAVEARVGSQLP